VDKVGVDLGCSVVTGRCGVRNFAVRGSFAVLFLDARTLFVRRWFAVLGASIAFFALSIRLTVGFDPGTGEVSDLPLVEPVASADFVPQPAAP
jgi:hypothetical protein